jgi:hypothetical protein
MRFVIRIVLPARLASMGAVPIAVLITMNATRILKFVKIMPAPHYVIRMTAIPSILKMLDARMASSNVSAMMAITAKNVIRRTSPTILVTLSTMTMENLLMKTHPTWVEISCV